MKAQNLDEVLK
jgi:hypothetical protein